MHLVDELYEELMIELESAWVLCHELCDGINELQEDGRVLVLMMGAFMCETMTELMTVQLEFTPNQREESVDFTMRSVQQNRSQTHQLRRAIPSIRTMHQHTIAAYYHTHIHTHKFIHITHTSHISTDTSYAHLVRRFDAQFEVI